MNVATGAGGQGGDPGAPGLPGAPGNDGSTTGVFSTSSDCETWDPCRNGEHLVQTLHLLLWVMERTGIQEQPSFFK